MLERPWPAARCCWPPSPGGSCGRRRRCCRCASSGARAFSAGNAAIFCAVGALFCGVFFFAQYMQSVLGAGPFGAGLRLLPWTGTLFFTAPLAGRLVDRVGERPLLVAGPLLQAVGFAWVALVAGPQTSYGALIAPLVVAGVGVSMSLPAAQNAVVSSIAAGGDRQGRRRQQERCASWAASSWISRRRRALRRRGRLRLRAGVQGDGFTAAIAGAGGAVG